MQKLLPKKMPQLSIPAQIVFGIVAGFFEYLLSYFFCYVLKVPLFMDCIWTIAASFFGTFSGLICGATLHILYFLLKLEQTPALFYAICSFSIVLIVRIFLRRDFMLTYFRLCLMDFVSILVISVEGGIIYIFISSTFNYYELSAINSFFSALLFNNVPVFLSSILGRIGINFLDKTISFILAFFFALVLEKILSRCTKICGGGYNRWKSL